MTPEERKYELLDRLERMILSFMQEFDIDMIEIIGVLELLKYNLLANMDEAEEAREDYEDEQRGEGGEEL
jgi:hypothetical protein